MSTKAITVGEVMKTLETYVTHHNPDARDWPFHMVDDLAVTAIYFDEEGETVYVSDEIDDA